MEHKFYYKNGRVASDRAYEEVLHREDGPAIEWADGGKSWLVNGKLHREDGPAVVYSKGLKEWWIDGILYSKTQYYKITKEVKKMSLEVKLTDPREWVRESALKKLKTI